MNPADGPRFGPGDAGSIRSPAFPAAGARQAAGEHRPRGRRRRAARNSSTSSAFDARFQAWGARCFAQPCEAWRAASGLQQDHALARDRRLAHSRNQQSGCSFPRATACRPQRAMPRCRHNCSIRSTRSTSLCRPAAPSPRRTAPTSPCGRTELAADDHDGVDQVEPGGTRRCLMTSMTSCATPSFRASGSCATRRRGCPSRARWRDGERARGPGPPRSAGSG